MTPFTIAFTRMGANLLKELPAGETANPTLGIGLCSYFQTPITRNLAPSEHINLMKLVEIIRDGTLREQTELIRAELSDKDAVRRDKVRLLPAIAPAGCFAQRNRDHLLAYSGIISLDLDDIDQPEALKQLLAADTQCPPLLIYTSVSGRGLKVFYRIVLTAHWNYLRWFDYYSEYLKQTYGITSDRACKDTSRLAFLNHDPEPYVQCGDI